VAAPSAVTSPVTSGEILRSLSVFTARPVSASAGRGEVTKGLKLQVFTTFRPTAWHYALYFVQQNTSRFRIQTTGTKIPLIIPQELEYIFVEISLFVRCVFKIALH
jgi:hypothetical protein